MALKKLKRLPPIKTYVINLSHRVERRKNVIKEFSYRSEFDVSIVEAIEEQFGALGLWKTICMIITQAYRQNINYILICEDDHKFTSAYSERKLRQSIEKAHLLEADILLGGASWIEDSVMVDKQLFWTKSFSGLQFTIIFKKFFDKILNANLVNYDAADHYICNLSNNILLMHPFVSKQRGYPYSDVTPLNNERGRVERLFHYSSAKLTRLRKISHYFKNIQCKGEIIALWDVEETMIPTYIINLRKRADRKRHILKQFKSRTEFQINFCYGVWNENGKVGLWESIRNVIKLANEKDEDVILICEDDHEFLPNYEKGFLIENIIKAYELGADVLLGGVSNFQSAVKATDNLFWVSEFYCTQFMIVYKKIFDSILNANYNNSTTADGIISSIATNKLVMHPFVSIQKDFGYSDITARSSSEIKSTVPFFDTMKRFDLMAIKQKQLDNLNGR
ncbi:hypothetical protein AB3466_01625 [Sphingobacterium thalpophilum]|uniref:hypothetical protein n=1 Tax=Sphingobacterium thalpophilum TaxID=259 RepID=UPI0031DFD284